MLMQDFRAIGYGATRFSFEQQGQSPAQFELGKGSHEAPPDADTPQSMETQPEETANRPFVSKGSIDMRL
jgi:hypothetical protein